MKAFTLATATALIVASATVSASANVEVEFDNFVAKYNKPYKNDAVEKAKRFENFKQNQIVAAFHQKKNPHATFGVNEYSDMSAAEFKVYHNAENHFKAQAAGKKLPPFKENFGTAVPQLDWRKKGAVTQVKNQGQCGSCWSFSTTGAIEGAWFLAGHTLTSLSEQFFVSCDTVDQGCNGGLPSQAIQWDVTDWPKGRVPTESSYPYTSGGGDDGTCVKSGWVTGAIITGARQVPSTEPAMWGAANVNPLSIGVDATSWQTYTGGIMTNCVSQQLDHGVLIVGFDLTYSIPYWIIKNSWGTSWGEEGYIRVEYGTNQCLLTSCPIVPDVQSPNPPPTFAPLPPTPAPTPAPPTPVPPPTPESAGWHMQYAPPGPGVMQMMMGISAIGDRDVYLAGMVTGSGANVGAQVAKYDGQVNGNINFLNSVDLPFMEMELCVGGQPGYPVGAVGGVQFPLIDKAPFAYLANSTTVVPSTITGPAQYMNVVQGCSNSPDGKYILGADQGSSNANMQALLSKDGGKTFAPVPFGNINIEQPNCTFPRYAAIASENVFYVTLGDWGSNNSGVSAHYENMRNVRDGKMEWQATATRKYVYDHVARKTRREVTGPLDVLKAMKKSGVAAGSGSSSSGSSYCGNSAEIIRTADGGKTWTKVFGSTEHFYFNEIACFSETRCIAVGEGFDVDPGVRVYVTSDGVNWERTFFKESTNEKSWSFFSVEVADQFSGEAWIGGTFQLPDQQAGGIFFHTRDFGKTWAEFKHDMPSLVEITQISFATNSFGRTGFAVAMDTFQASQILRYDSHKIGPGPKYQSFFTQKSCVDATCALLCQSIEFPEYMCIQANGGGAITAYCSGNNLVQTLYETTDCSGSGQQSTVPLNKCLSNSGQYFEFTCNTTSSSAHQQMINKASDVHLPRRMYNPKKDKVMKL